MAYKQEPGREPLNAYGPLKEMGLIKPPKKAIFGQKPKKRKDKVKEGRRAGVATGIAAGLFFGLTPAVRAIQKTFGKG